MPVPTWNVGQVLASADVNTWFVPRAVVAVADQSVVSSTTLVSDGTLVLPVDAGAVYEFSYVGVFDGAAAGGVAINFTLPAGAVMGVCLPASGTAAGALEIPFPGLSITSGVTLQGANNNQTVFLAGTLVAGGTAGNLTHQFAQVTSNGTATRRRAHSRMVLRRIG